MDAKKYLIENRKSRLMISYENEDNVWWAYLTVGRKVIDKQSFASMGELIIFLNLNDSFGKEPESREKAV